MANSPIETTYLIIGGGIAGVTCTETLAFLSPEESIVLLSASPLIKAVTNLVKVTKVLETFDIEEKPIADYQKANERVQMYHKFISRLDTAHHELYCEDGTSFRYKKLCICTGGRPNLILPDNPFVIGIRDIESVEVFQKKLSNARRIAIVGNGGIATELVYEIEGCEVLWIVKDEHISHTFMDAAAARFFLDIVNNKKAKPDNVVKRTKYTSADASGETTISKMSGSALGPDWHSGLTMSGQFGKGFSVSHHVHIEYESHVQTVLSPEEMQERKKEATNVPNSSNDEADWQVYVELTSGKIYGCDFIVSATGAVPYVKPFLPGNPFELSKDGGLKVNDKMETSVLDVYAAGDCCTASWEPAPHWFQMRLWSQARQMAYYAAKCMAASLTGEEVLMDFCFELFAHVTKFFNFKVVLLGKYNAQDLPPGYEYYVRYTKDLEYIKLVVAEGKVQGALLIGETDLEETFENLILNQLDISQFGENILDPNIAIDDYFD